MRRPAARAFAPSLASRSVRAGFIALALALGGLAGTPSAKAACPQLLENNEFSGATIPPWRMDVDSPDVNAQLSVSDDSYKTLNLLILAAPLGSTFALAQPVPIEKDHQYRLSFYMFGATARSARVMVRNAASPSLTYGLDQPFVVSSNVSDATQAFTFTATASDPQADLAIVFAYDNGVFFKFDSLFLEETSSPLCGGAGGAGGAGGKGGAQGRAGAGGGGGAGGVGGARPTGGGAGQGGATGGAGASGQGGAGGLVMVPGGGAGGAGGTSGAAGAGGPAGAAGTGEPQGGRAAVGGGGASGGAAGAAGQGDAGGGAQGGSPTGGLDAGSGDASACTTCSDGGAVPPPSSDGCSCELSPGPSMQRQLQTGGPFFALLLWKLRRRRRRRATTIGADGSAGASTTLTLLALMAAWPLGCNDGHRLDAMKGTGGASTGGTSTGGTSTGGANTGGTTSSGGSPGSGGAGGAACAPIPVPAGGKVCGDLVIATDADAIAAQDCTETTGSLTISPFFVGTVDLPRLRKVGKDVRRDGAPAPSPPNDPAKTTRILLPNVTQIGGDLWFYLDFNLVELDLRSVQTIGGRAWVYRDTLIRTLRLDALSQVGMDFYIADVFQLPECVANDIASHVTAGQTVLVTATKTPPNCHCAQICNHVEQFCP